MENVKRQPELAKILCNTCGADETQLLWKIAVSETKYNIDPSLKFNIVRCQQCGLIYINPRLTENDTDNIYIECLKHFPEEEIKQSDARRKSDAVRHLLQLKKLIPSGKLLELGFGFGTFLKEAHDAGYDAIGIEMSEEHYTNCKKMGLNVIHDRIQNVSFSKEYFDIIYANQLFEHLYDPKGVLEIASPFLKMGGILMVGVPNIGCLSAKIHGKKWEHLSPVEHLFYYNYKTLSHLFSRCGFKVIDNPVIFPRCSGAFSLAQRCRWYGKNALRIPKTILENLIGFRLFELLLIGRKTYQLEK